MDNNWSTCANWSSNTCPGSSDVAVFDGTSSDDATVDASYAGSVGGLQINAGYSGIITLARGLTIGTSDYTQAAGTFSQSSQTLTLAGADFTMTGGTFNANTGTTSFTSTSATFDVVTSLTLNNVTIGKNNSSTAQTIATGDTMVVTGTLTINGNGPINGPGVIEMQGANTVISSAGATGTVVVQYLVAGDQTITASGGAIPGMLVNKPSGTITQSGSYSVSTGDFTLQSGTYNVGNNTFTLAGADFTMTGGTFTPSTGTVAFTSTTGVFDVVTSLTLNNVTFGKANAGTPQSIATGDTMIVTGTLTINGNGPVNGPGSLEMRGSNTVIDSTGANGTLVVQYLEAGDQTITSSGGSIPGILMNKPSGTITQSGSLSVRDSDFALQSGTYNVGNNTFTLNGADFTLTGGTFTPSTGTVAFTGPSGTFDVLTSLTLNNVTFGKANSGTPQTIATGDTMIVTGTLTVNGNGPLNGPGSLEMQGANTVISSAGATGTLVVKYLEAGDQTITASGGAIPGMLINKPSGTITQSGSYSVSSGDFALQSGTYNVGNNTFTLAGADFTMTGGTFTPSTGTVAFTTASATFDVATSLTLNNVTFAKSNAGTSQTIASGDTMVVTGTLAFNGNGPVNGPGIIDMQGTTTTVAGLAGGTVPLTFSGTAEQTYQLTSGDEADGDVTINKASGALTLLSNFDLDAAGQALTITAGTLKLSGRNVTVTDALTVGASGVLERYGAETITRGSLSLASGSTVRYTGDGDTAVDSYVLTTFSTTYHHLIVNSTDGATDSFAISASPLNVNGSLTLTAGTITGGSGTINVAGNWSNTATFTAQTSTVVLNGSHQTLSGSTTFNNFTKSVTSAATLTFTAGTTQTIAGTWTVNGSDGQLLSLRSSSEDSEWFVNPQGTRTISYLDVQDSNNTNATAITVSGLTVANSGNNTNWAFIAVGSVTGQNPQTTAGGKSITINGANFAATPTVTIGGSAATSVVFVSETVLTAVAPAKAAGSYDVVITNPDAQSQTCSGCMTYIAPPTISTINETYTTTAGGATRTITGSGMLVGANAVLVDAAVVTTTGLSTAITFTTPAHAAGQVILRVYGISGTNSNGIYTDTANGFLTYEAPPTISTINETYTTTAGGATRVITGTGLLVGANTLKVDSTLVGTTGNATELTFTTPAHAAGGVVLRGYSANGSDTNGLYSDTALGFLQYEAPPTVSLISPATDLSTSAPTTVTVTGTNLKVGTPGVTIDPAGTATDVTTTGTDTEVTFEAPARAAGTVSLRFYSPHGTVSNQLYLDSGTLVFADPPPSSTPTTGGGGIAGPIAPPPVDPDLDIAYDDPPGETIVELEPIPGVPNGTPSINDPSDPLVTPADPSQPTPTNSQSPAVEDPVRSPSEPTGAGPAPSGSGSPALPQPTREPVDSRPPQDDAFVAGTALSQPFAALYAQAFSLARDYKSMVVSLSGLVLGTLGTLSVLVVGPNSLFDLFVLRSRFIDFALSALGLRKRKPWGTVFDSVTKQQLDPVYVVLQNEQGEEVQTSITDLNGRYGFLVPPGVYRMVVNKTHYQFPSQHVQGRQRDELYDNLYFGETITVSESGAVILRNIPMDPVAFDWNEFAKKEKGLLQTNARHAWALLFITTWLYRLGFAAAVLNLIQQTTRFNFAVVILYSLVALLRQMDMRPRPYGAIVERRTGNPLSFAVVAVRHASQPKELFHTVADALGRYYLLVSPDEYIIEIRSRNADGSYTTVSTSPPTRVRRGFINANIKV